MTVPLRPQLRSLEAFPVGPKEELLAVLRDPEGYGETVVMPYGAALLTSFMDGQHTLAEIRELLKSNVGAHVSLGDLKRLASQLQRAHLLEGNAFEQFRGKRDQQYMAAPVRPASHAGSAYAGEPGELRSQLAGLFTCKTGPGPIGAAPTTNGQQLCAIISPHIDLHRGGPTFAWAYRQLAEQSEADLFVIFGTAHSPMDQLFTVTRKDFATPLGTVKTNQAFIDALGKRLASDPAGRQLDLFEDELAHRHEHSIEFQVVFLQYLLGSKRPFSIVPVLVGSFHRFLGNGRQPHQSPEVNAFIEAMRAMAEEYQRRICFISGADLAHIGQRFGDPWLLNKKRLAAQSADDRQLLQTACRGDGTGFFEHVAASGDRNRICGLAPTYVMLHVVSPARGELLQYDQAVEPDGASCVSFASLAFYRP